MDLESIQANIDYAKHLGMERITLSLSLADAQRIVDLESDKAELLAALKREHAANLAILNVLSQAYDRFTDNDMYPANYELKKWKSAARVCLEHGSSETTQAAIAKAEK